MTTGRSQPAVLITRSIFHAAAIVLFAAAPAAVSQPTTVPGTAPATSLPTSPVQGQWKGREFRDGVNADDEGRDIVYWEDNAPVPNRYVYATGYVTEENGATRFATFRYNADHPGPVQVADKRAYFPVLPPETAEQHKAVAMTVDHLGNVYVTGESPNPVNGKLDVVTIKYDWELKQPVGPLNTPWPATTDGPGVRRWDGILVPGNPPEGGHDVPTDITVGGELMVIVAATTEWHQGGKDIVAIAYQADGQPHTNWPHIDAGPGVRKYGGPESGEDRSCEIGGPFVVTDGSEELRVTINGTTRDDPNDYDDIVTLEFRAGGDGIRWSHRFDGGCGLDDVATGLAFPNDEYGGIVYSVGYSETCMDHPYPNDFLIIAYETGAPPFMSRLLWSDKYDFGRDDYSADVRAIRGWNGENEIAITGRSSGGGINTAATLLYNDYSNFPRPLPYISRRTHQFSAVAGRIDDGLGVEVRPAPVSPEIYLTGRSTAALATNFDALIVRLASTSPITTQWWTLFSDTGNPGYDAGHAIVTDKQVFPAKPRVFFTGTSFNTGSGKDFVTVGYTQN